jgi:hypothetical protein
MQDKRQKFKWERIFTSHNALFGGTNTSRAKVLGGWLINNQTYTNSCINGERNICESMCFVPDQNHEWKVDAV